MALIIRTDGINDAFSSVMEQVAPSCMNDHELIKFHGVVRHVIIDTTS